MLPSSLSSLLPSPGCSVSTSSSYVSERLPGTRLSASSAGCGGVVTGFVSDALVASGCAGVASPGNSVSTNRACGETYMRFVTGSRHMCPGWSRARPSMIFGNTRQPIGLTPAQDGTCPVKQNHGASVGTMREGSVAETSVDDFRWYHQK
eukprot:3577642-Pleurochrysis_carterae.AAC.3